MDNMRCILQYHMEDYGCVRVKLAEVLSSRGITRNRLRTLTGVKYEVIDRYFKGVRVEKVDLDFLAKVCYVLNCEIGDLLEYCPPNEQKTSL